MRITKEQVARAIELAIPQLACRLPKDVYGALLSAYAKDDHLRGTAVLDDLLKNASIACHDSVPICQDTGSVWISLEIGPDVEVAGDVLNGVDEAVAKAYTAARLRFSIVRDALVDRTNTGDNTPAFTEVRFVDEPGCARLGIMLKGGGSDNASMLEMLVPGAGRKGVLERVIARIAEKASSACAPLVVGVGIGSTFDKVGSLAKHALMREVGAPAATESARELEEEIMERVAQAGIGAGGLGGPSAALAVHVETAACHISALPLAVNMGCSALRRATIDLSGDDGVLEQLDRQLVTLDDFVAEPESKAEGAGEAPLALELPLAREQAKSLRAGQRCLLSGSIYTLRDAGHMRLLRELDDCDGTLPYGLDGQAIFYSGPTPPAAGRPFGAVGPTTSGRMDFAAPALYDAGVVATIGKGARNDAVHEACVRNGAIYFVATGGAAALLAKRVEEAQVIAYDDLGTEALRKLDIKDFPVFVGIDSMGADVYEDDSWLTGTIE